MNPIDAMKMIESPEFAAYVNIASSYKVFLRLVASHEAIPCIRATMDQPSVADALLGRIKALTSIPPQDGFEHPHDTALAAYLLLLSEKGVPQAMTALALIGKTTGLHWAEQVARKTPIRNLSISTDAKDAVATPSIHEVA